MGYLTQYQNILNKLFMNTFKCTLVIMRTYGLKRRPLHEEVISCIEEDADKLKLPNRNARFLRDTPQ